MQGYLQVLAKEASVYLQKSPHVCLIRFDFLLSLLAHHLLPAYLFADSSYLNFLYSDRDLNPQCLYSSQI